MKWQELTITTNEASSDLVSDLLFSLGANGVELVDPPAFRKVLSDNAHLDYADEGFIERYGSDVIVRAYFQDGREAKGLRRIVTEGLLALSLEPGVSESNVTVKLRDDEEWKDVWKTFYVPFEIAPGFIIKPSWEEYEPKADEIILEMDPGMAFGTGTHETTRMCAKFAARHVKHGDSVLDIGCGTGILGIVAANCGAAEVLAIDIDDAAVKCARENVQKNRVSDRVHVVQGTLEDVPPVKRDVILINIVADIIIGLTPKFPDHLTENGLLVVSGIIHSRVQDVISACELQGFVIVEHDTEGEWDAMVFRCIGS